MIRRNFPNQAFLIGPLLNREGGAAQTVDAEITVVMDGEVQGGSEGALTHVIEGVWLYAPTQAETNCAILGVVLTGPESIAVPLNLVTTAGDPQDAEAFGLSDLSQLPDKVDQILRNSRRGGLVPIIRPVS